MSHTLHVRRELQPNAHLLCMLRQETGQSSIGGHAYSYRMSTYNRPSVLLQGSECLDWLARCDPYMEQVRCQVGRCLPRLSRKSQDHHQSTLTTTASEGEISLPRPFALVVSILERWDNWGKCLTLEGTRSLWILCIIIKQCIVIFNVTCLISQLPVDGKMVTVTHEYNACWVVINTINTDRSLTAHHSIECYMLVCISEQTTCKVGAAPAIAMATQTNFSFFILINLNKNIRKGKKNVLFHYYFYFLFKVY